MAFHLAVTLARGANSGLRTRFSAGAAVLAQLRDDGALHVTGRFGYPGGDQLPSRFPLTEDWPVIRALRQLESKRASTPPKKHGNLPL